MEKHGYVYIAVNPSVVWIKVGEALDPVKRLRGLHRDNTSLYSAAEPWEVVYTFPSCDCRRFERLVHEAIYEEHDQHQELFNCTAAQATAIARRVLADNPQLQLAGHVPGDVAELTVERDAAKAQEQRQAQAERDSEAAASRAKFDEDLRLSSVASKKREHAKLVDLANERGPEYEKLDKAGRWPLLFGIIAIAALFTETDLGNAMFVIFGLLSAVNGVAVNTKRYKAVDKARAETGYKSPYQLAKEASAKSAKDSRLAIDRSIKLDHIKAARGMYEQGLELVATLAAIKSAREDGVVSEQRALATLVEQDGAREWRITGSISDARIQRGIAAERAGVQHAIDVERAEWQAAARKQGQRVFLTPTTRAPKEQAAVESVASVQARYRAARVA